LEAQLQEMDALKDAKGEEEALQAQVEQLTQAKNEEAN